MSEIRSEPMDELVDLRELYVRTLPEKVRLIEACVAEILAAGPDAQRLTDLTHLAHRLTGSSAIYGFEAVSQAAARLEDVALGALERPRPSGPELAAEIERKLQALREAADHVAPSARAGGAEDR